MEPASDADIPMSAEASDLPSTLADNRIPVLISADTTEDASTAPASPEPGTKSDAVREDEPDTEPVSRIPVERLPLTEAEQVNDAVAAIWVDRAPETVDAASNAADIWMPV